MTDLTPFADLADVLDRLPTLIRDTRRQRRLSLRAAADQSGVNFVTLKRIEDGHGFEFQHVPKLLRWLDGAA